MIFIGSDHGGFGLKKIIKDYLQEKGYQLFDVGADTEAASDYPVYAEKVADEVVKDPNNRGILICRNGAGVCIVANKFAGVLAGTVWTKEIAASIRNDDRANVMCLPADHISSEEALAAVQVFLDTSFSGEDRHKRRLDQITKIEQAK